MLRYSQVYELTRNKITVGETFALSLLSIYRGDVLEPIVLFVQSRSPTFAVWTIGLRESLVRLTNPTISRSTTRALLSLPIFPLFAFFPFNATFSKRRTKDYYQSSKRTYQLRPKVISFEENSPGEYANEYLRRADKTKPYTPRIISRTDRARRAS